jgi:hypothetical protein
MMEYYEMIRTYISVGQMGVWTYWIPMVLCLIGYTGRTWKQVYALNHSERYVPPLTVGLLVGRLLCSILPIVNIVALVFSLSSGMFKSVFWFIDKVMSYEIVKNKT